MISVAGITKRFGSLLAVSELSLDVRPGEMFGLIGPDGAGKTTTLRMVLGLLRPDAGAVRTCGLDPLRHHRALTQRVGYLSQRFSLYGDLSVDENIGFFAELHGVRNWRGRRDELLDMVRMSPFRDRLADRLSGGMKQKLALACTLIHTPELLVLDEPTTGVDPVSRRDFWRLLARLQQDGLTILLTTPYLDEAERCARVALIDEGRRLLLDAPGVLRRLDDELLIEVIARPFRRAAEVLRREPEVLSVEVFGERLHVAARGRQADGGGMAERIRGVLLQAGVDVESARSTLPSLEDVFIRRIRAAHAKGADRVEVEA
jgi:ABC-2 type transport system ATP-binding protein